jgi:hypothetical protein
MKGILDPSFRYTPSYATDVRRTFERIRRGQIPRGDDTAPASQPAGQKVLPLTMRKPERK